MADTVYVDGSTLLTADTMNDVNRLQYTILGDPADAAAVSSPLSTKTTVASATTPDIFAVTVGQVVDYTGTATCTGFVAAPQAGAQRKLVCAGACLFTAGANLLIEGMPSGTTIAMAANAIVNVLAITTTQFKITYSVSGTFTATASTGMTTTPSGTATYSVINGNVSVSLPELTGTSNSAFFFITGLPDCITPTTSIAASLPIGSGQNNGSSTTLNSQIINDNRFSLNYGAGIAAFTTSGTKTCSFGCTVNYRIN